MGRPSPRAPKTSTPKATLLPKRPGKFRKKTVSRAMET
jgi:hypothetical protein